MRVLSDEDLEKADEVELHPKDSRDTKHLAQRGFCPSAGDWRHDMHAAPIRQPSRGECVAINCTIPVHRLRSKGELVRVIAPLMLEAVREIENALARPAGIEPATPGFGGQYSIR